MNLVIPDAQFEGDPILEAEVLGPGVNITVFTPDKTHSIPDSVWKETDAVICYHHLQATDALLARMPKLALLVRAGVGYDNIDVAAAAARKVPVCNVPDYGTLEVADHSIALLLALARSVPTYTDSLFRLGAKGWQYERGITVRRLNGLTYAALGLGPIGAAAALRAKAFGMNVVFYDPFLPAGVEASLGFKRARTFEALVDNADVLNICAPLNKSTLKLVNTSTLGRMARGAYVVNTSRGAIVDTGALLECLRSGQVSGAALDVLPDEADFENDPLVAAWRNGDPTLADRVILTPHAAWYSASSKIDLRQKSAEVVRDFIRGDVRNCVNKSIFQKINNT